MGRLWVKGTAASVTNAVLFPLTMGTVSGLLTSNVLSVTTDLTNITYTRAHARTHTHTHKITHSKSGNVAPLLSSDDKQLVTLQKHTLVTLTQCKVFPCPTYGFKIDHERFIACEFYDRY